jgi:Sulfotransferase family
MTTLRASVLGLIPEPMMPVARTLNYTARGTRAKLRARLKPTLVVDDVVPIFIIGCGRSGTTLLGELFAMHPRISYIFERYDLWAAIHPVTDFSQLYSRGEGHCLLDARSATNTAKSRFRRLMSPRPGFTLVEKSPINALRIGFLEVVAPGARFVHIVRDGVIVAHSIEQKARVTRRLALRAPLNNWWGVGDVKWTTLKQDGRAAGYYPDEVHQLTTDAQRGAYEWLLSLHEVNAWRARLGPRLIELRLDDLISDPRKVLGSSIDALGLPIPDGDWLDRAILKVHQPPNKFDTELVLPGQMQVDFNNFQESYDFEYRATTKDLNAELSQEDVRSSPVFAREPSSTPGPY